jgi:ribosomal protein S27AE
MTHYSAITRAIQHHYGYRPVKRVCPECGLDQPTLGSFPTTNILGAAGLLWATSNRRPISSGTLHCPRCGAAMTLTEELERRKRNRGK